MIHQKLTLTNDVYETMNRLGSQRKPFLFIVDFEGKTPLVISPEEAAFQRIFFDIRGKNNLKSDFQSDNDDPIYFEKYPVDFDTYQQAFNKVITELRLGNSYLLNLTFPSQIKINRSFEEIFINSKAPYRLVIDQKFVVFSPESFVQISNNLIRSFPMKGTIDADLPDASTKLLSDRKETAEHNTIVDLIRNDLSIVSQNVRVERFRYIEKISTNQKNLLQASSEIVGNLNENWHSKIGDILNKMLPAGSISGAPKSRTIDIIRQAETGDRGYYTGVFGIYDGATLDSAVMIRYIENRNGQYIFRSGGGITVNSNVLTEYQEMIDKVYVPFI